MIILNEKQYAEEYLNIPIIKTSPLETVKVLAKYYYHVMGYKKKKITEELTEYLSDKYPTYQFQKEQWRTTIEKIATKVNKSILYETPYVGISKSELEKIDGANMDARHKQLMFAILCLAKYALTRNPNSNGWVNVELGEIFKMANLGASNAIRRSRMAGDLELLELLEFPKKNGNLSMRVTFIDNKDEFLKIEDFDTLGYKYLQYTGDKNIVPCLKCGKLIRQNRNGTKKYCKECTSYTPIMNKTIICIDCGKEFKVSSRDSKTIRCEECRQKHAKEMKKDANKRYYLSHKN